MNETSNRKIIKNTTLFAIGNILTKAVQFIIVPFLTFLLSTEEYGTIDVILTTSTILIAIFGLCIIEGVFRYTLDNTQDKKGVFTFGILVATCGSLLLILLYFLLRKIEIIRLYGLSAMLYIIFTIFHGIIHYFIKALEKIKLFVFNSVLYSILSSAFAIVFIKVFKLGVNGYFYGYALALFICMCMMFMCCKLYKYLNIKKITKPIMMSMLSFSIPLIFNSISWWIMDISDKYTVLYKMGRSANGILGIVHKIPSIITMVFSVFAQAFVLSAIVDMDISKKDDADKFKHIFNSLNIILCLGVGFIIILIEPFTKVFIAKDYYESWKYVPIMAFATLFNSMSAYCGLVYTIKKKNISFAISSIIGGVTNFIVCILLIDKIGLYAAALSTLVANLIIFIYRIIDIQKFIKININVKAYILIACITIQCIVCCINSLSTMNMLIINGIILLFMIIMSYKTIINTIAGIFKSLKK